MLIKSADDKGVNSQARRKAQHFIVLAFAQVHCFAFHLVFCAFADFCNYALGHAQQINYLKSPHAVTPAK